jgi:hypothetical protein
VWTAKWSWASQRISTNLQVDELFLEIAKLLTYRVLLWKEAVTILISQEIKIKGHPLEM